MTATAAAGLLLDKPLPPSPIVGPPAVPEKDMDKMPPRPVANNTPVDIITRIARATSLSQQSTHSQSSLSDKSIISNSSGGSGSVNGSASSCDSHTPSTPSTSASEGTPESVGQLGLQRFPTGESAYKFRLSKPRSGDPSPRQSLDAVVAKTSRATSTMSSSSARSSSGSSGFKFPKPSLSFKPLLYNHGNGSKDHHLYHHHNSSSSSSTSPNGLPHQAIDPIGNSPFPSILMSIKLPQSLLNKYAIDQEGFRQGKGIWGIGQYSWTITVLSRTNGKKYVIKRVSKSLLPPSAYYQYPRTAHQLCTCPACKSSREHLLMTGQLDQLDQHELENIQEVLVIQNKGRKELPQQQKAPLQRPLSASSMATPTTKRRSFNQNNSGTPTQHAQTASPSSSPLISPVCSRPSTPTPSLLRMFSSSAATASTLTPAPKVHNRSQNHYHTICSPSKRQTTNILRSPLLSTAPPPLWPQKKESDSMVPQTGPESPSHGPQPNTRASLEITTALSRSGSRYSLKKWQALQRRASTPNLSRPATGLDDSTEDEAPSRPLTRFSTDDWRSRDRKSHQQGFQPFVLGHDQQPYLDSPLPMTPSMSPFQSTTTGADDKSPRGSFDRRPGSPRASLERTVSPFDTNGGEFKQLDPESLRPHKAAAPKGYVPPPHALPMELVLLQTFNDSDHLPEHHEWTQDESYWYYVTKAHGVRRRKLKKVSTWWLDMGSLGSVLLSGSSSSSSEPIATGPIYNMGHSTGSSTPNPSSSPLSSEVALSSGRQTPILGQEPSTTSSGLIRKQSSPRNSSHMGKYYAVDWEEYIST